MLKNSTIHTIVKELNINDIYKWFYKYKYKLKNNDHLLPIIMKNSNSMAFNIIKNIEQIKDGQLIVQCIFNKKSGKLEDKYRIIKTFHIPKQIENMFDDTGMIVFEKDFIFD